MNAHLASEFLSFDQAELKKRWAAGHPIDPCSLDDSEYRGVSLGLPGFIVKHTWLTFRKTFYRDPTTGTLRGWNVRMQQFGLDGEHQPQLTRKGDPRCFGFYDVVPLDRRNAADDPTGPLLIDYGWSGLRDPIVALHHNDATRLLGFTYFTLGPLRIATPSFFLLEREGPLTFVPPMKER